MMTSIVSGLQGSPPEGHHSGYPFLAGEYVVATLGILFSSLLVYWNIHSIITLIF